MEKRNPGRPLVVAWRDEDSVEALHRAYRQEGRAAVRDRLQALWLLRQGGTVGGVAAVLGVDYRSVQRWVAWYRQGGLALVRQRRRGGYGQPSRLTPEQEEQVAREVATGRFRTAAEIGQWINVTYGMSYTVGGIYSLLERMRCAPKVPRPIHVKADQTEQEAWKQGGLSPS